MNDRNIWDKPISHGEILKKIWKHLDLGTLEREHPFHTPVVGTVDDGAPSLRTVVLRRFWRRPPRLAFHAHAGSPKIAQIKDNPNLYWLFYHPQEKFQVRVRSLAEIHADDELHEEQWCATGLFSRRCYIGEAPTKESGKPTSGLPEDLLACKPTSEESENGKANFVVVSARIVSIDCMELDKRGHRRSLFVWKENGESETRWLTP